LHCVQHSAQGVLAAIGVPAAFGGGSLRLSVGRHSTADEVRRGAALIVAGIREQRRRVQCGSGTVVHSQQLH
jgi:cysteine sulfinate desulfinase/cysteine desulfurase-like protein